MNTNFCRISRILALILLVCIGNTSVHAQLVLDASDPDDSRAALQDLLLELGDYSIDNDADSDGDGYSNGEELLIGSDPYDPSDLSGVPSDHTTCNWRESASQQLLWNIGREAIDDVAAHFQELESPDPQLRELAETRIVEKISTHLDTVTDCGCRYFALHFIVDEISRRMNGADISLDLRFRLARIIGLLENAVSVSEPDCVGTDVPGYYEQFIPGYRDE